MATLEEVTQGLTDLTAAATEGVATLGLLDTKLDEIRTFIEGLQGGQLVTQEQLDAVFAQIDAAKTIVAEGRTKATAALEEADALDE